VRSRRASLAWKEWKEKVVTEPVAHTLDQGPVHLPLCRARTETQYMMYETEDHVVNVRDNERRAYSTMG